MDEGTRLILIRIIELSFEYLYQGYFNKDVKDYPHNFNKLAEEQ